MNHGEQFLRLAREAKKTVQEIGVEELRKRLALHDGFRLIDIREDHEWDRGAIPGAEHLCRGILERDIEKVVPDKRAEIILYCGGGYRSLLSAESLQKMGYERVYSLDEGWVGWKKRQLPLQ